MDAKFYQELNASTQAAAKKYIANKQKSDARKARDQAMRDIGMVKVKSDSGKVYYE